MKERDKKGTKSRKKNRIIEKSKEKRATMDEGQANFRRVAGEREREIIATDSRS